MPRATRKLKNGPLKKLVQHAYAKGYVDALLGNGSVFVPGVGLVSGLVGEKSLFHLKEPGYSGPAEFINTLHGPVACQRPELKGFILGKKLKSSKSI